MTKTMMVLCGATMLATGPALAACVVDAPLDTPNQPSPQVVVTGDDVVIIGDRLITLLMNAAYQRPGGRAVVIVALAATRVEMGGDEVKIDTTGERLDVATEGRPQ